MHRGTHEPPLEIIFLEGTSLKVLYFRYYYDYFTLCYFFYDGSWNTYALRSVRYTLNYDH